MKPKPFTFTSEEIKDIVVTFDYCIEDFIQILRQTPEDKRERMFRSIEMRMNTSIQIMAEKIWPIS